MADEPGLIVNPEIPTGPGENPLAQEGNQLGAPAANPIVDPAAAEQNALRAQMMQFPEPPRQQEHRPMGIVPAVDPNRPTPVVVAPVDFFGDLKQFMRMKMDEAIRAARTFQASAVASEAQALRNAHEDILTAIDHIAMTVRDTLMDIRFITQPPDPILFERADRCTISLASNHPNYAAITGAAKNSMRNILNPALADAAIMRVTCNQQEGMINLILGAAANRRWFFLVTCEHHHFAIENLHGVTIMGRTRILIETPNEKGYFYMYLVRRGFGG